MVGKSQPQESEGAGHVAHTVKKQRVMNHSACFLHSYTTQDPCLENGAAHRGECLLILMDRIKVIPNKHSMIGTTKQTAVAAMPRPISG